MTSHEYTDYTSEWHVNLLVIYAVGALFLSGQRALCQGRAPRQIALTIGSQVDIPARGKNQLSSIRDVAVSADGTVYVLDPRAQRFDAFSVDGTLVATASLSDRDGKNITGHLLAPLPTGGAIVYDAAANRIHRYSLRGGMLKEVGSVTVGVETAKDICVLGDTLYLLAYRNDRIVQAYLTDGRHLGSFGVPPGSTTAVRRAVVGAGGHLSCSVRSRTVTVELTASDRITAFHSDGTEAWQYIIPGFQGISFRTKPDGGVQISTDATSRDGVASIFGTGTAYTTIQVIRLRPGETRIESTMLRNSDGAPVATLSTIPMMREANASFMIETPSALRIRALFYHVQNKGHP